MYSRNKHGMRASRLARAKAEKACDSAKKAGASRPGRRTRVGLIWQAFVTSFNQT